MSNLSKKRPGVGTRFIASVKSMAIRALQCYVPKARPYARAFPTPVSHPPVDFALFPLPNC